MNLLALIATLILLFGCASSKPTVGGLLSSQLNTSGDSIVKPYVDLVDGSRIYAKAVNIGGSGFKYIIEADKTKYKVSELKDFHIYFVQKLGFSNKYDTTNRYYTVIDKNFYETLVTGDKISVYRDQTNLNTGEPTKGSIIVYKYFYIKNGGTRKPLNSMDDLIEAIGDCKSTKGIKNFELSDLKAEIKINKRFLIEFFEKYNKECK